MEYDTSASFVKNYIKNNQEQHTIEMSKNHYYHINIMEHLFLLRLYKIFFNYKFIKQINI